MINVELGIAVLVVVGMYTAVRQMLTQMDNKRQQDALDEELAAIRATADRRKDQ